MSNKTRQVPQKELTEEQRQEAFLRQYQLKKASIAEGVLYNLCTNSGLTSTAIADPKAIVEAVDKIATLYMEIVWHQKVNLKEEE